MSAPGVAGERGFHGDVQAADRADRFDGSFGLGEIAVGRNFELNFQHALFPDAEG
jgi:hypothetical protein